LTKSKVFFDVASSLDDFIAPEGMEMARADDPEYKHWLALWSKLQSWVFQQKFFRENLKIGEGGETSHDNRLLEETFKRTGVSIMGNRMFEGGERFWPEEAPFQTPVFVLTHEVRKPWVRPGGTTFHFVNDDIESTLEKAKKTAGTKDIRIAGGAKYYPTISQRWTSGRIYDSLFTSVFRQGTQLFSGIAKNLKVKIKESLPSKEVTHVTFQVEE
jgi:dihydrofolate reductase